jgi:serine/threonine protein kinase
LPDFSGITWEKVDVFALGVTFFAAHFYKSPLERGRAHVEDPFYRLVAQNDFDGFWKYDAQVRRIAESLALRKDGRSEELSNLLWRMISLDPQKRPSFAEILEHPFFA